MIEVGEGGADWTVEETDTMTQQRENPSHSRGANREDIFFPVGGDRRSFAIGSLAVRDDVAKGMGTSSRRWRRSGMERRLGHYNLLRVKCPC